ncbi:cobaltochelatase CobT-related protein [Thiolapillus sp.]|uniref:cobaltochelatase CobT-related protein n=13 Tax=Thiolapillus sp. TaxID=2017437 RepID=UPI003AF8E67D
MISEEELAAAFPHVPDGRENRSLNASWRAIATVVAGHTGLRFVSHAGTAYAKYDPDTGKAVVNVPPLPEGRAAHILALGYSAHEGGHIRFSDYSVKHPIPFGHSLVRAMEEFRMEAQVIKNYPGARRILQDIVQYMVLTGKSFAPTDEEKLRSATPNSLVTNYVLVRGRYLVNNQTAVEPRMNQLREELVARTSDELVDQIDDIIRRAGAAPSEGDLIPLADELIALLQQDAEQPEDGQNGEPDDSKPDDSDAGNGESDDSKPDDSDAGNGEPDDSEPDDADAGNGESDDSEPDDADAGNGEPDDSEPDDSDAGNGESDDSEPDDSDAGNGEPDDSKPDDSDAGNGESDDSKSDDSDAGNGEPDDSEPDDSDAGNGESDDSEPDDADAGNGGDPKGAGQLAIDPSAEGPVDDDLGQALEALLNEHAENDGEDTTGWSGEMAEVVEHPRVLTNNPFDPERVVHETAAVQRTLAQVFQAQKRVEVAHSSRGRRINPRRLSRVAMGKADIFRHKHRQEAINTAVEVLVDASESMMWGDDLLTPAKESALALAQAIENLPGCSCGVLMFPSWTDNGEIAVLGVKAPEERVSATLQQGRWEFGAYGGTPLAQSLWPCAIRLATRLEERKVLIVLTDGDPNDSVAAMEMLERIRASGIETVGIGIQTMAVESLFPEHRVINDVAELGEALFDLMINKLHLKTA